MSGFTHSLLRVPFLALIIQNVLALTLTMNWTGNVDLETCSGAAAVAAAVVGGGCCWLLLICRLLGACGSRCSSDGRSFLFFLACLSCNGNTGWSVYSVG